MPETVENIIAESRATRQRISAERASRIASSRAENSDAALRGRLNATIERINRNEAASEHRFRAASITAARPNFLTENTREGYSSPEGRERRRSFVAWMRGGTPQAALQTSTDPGGGVFVPLEISRTIRENLIYADQIRRVATVLTTGTDTLRIPERTANSQAQWLAETDPDGITGPTYGAADIPVSGIRCEIPVSNDFLADSAIDVEAWITKELSQLFAKTEGAAFIAGSGVKQPLGILNGTGFAAANSFPSGNVSALTSDSIVALPFQLPAVYAQQGAWLMNRGTMGLIRELKDSAGRYLFDAQSTLDKEGLPTIQGRPVIDCPSMPNVAANAFPIIFGDISLAYIIVERMNISMIRDPYTLASQNMTRFVAMRRVGGAPVLGEAMIKLRVATS
jgi:HK97 family phage major capsid protein